MKQQNLQGIDDVLLAFERLGHDLPGTDLPQLDYFNQTYLIITRNVRQRLRTGDFEHPNFLRRFDTRFAYYYLRALRQFVEGDQPPRAWRQAFSVAQRGSASPLILLALGVNAHVNNDIPQVLRDAGADKRHYRDYRLVNQIIGGSLAEVIDYIKDDRVLSPHRQPLKTLYKMGMVVLIRLWRYTAWQKFRKLQRHTKQVSDVEDAADEIGRELQKLPL